MIPPTICDFLYIFSPSYFPQFQYCRSVCDCQLITDDNVIVMDPGNGTVVDQCVGGLNDGKACCKFACSVM